MSVLEAIIQNSDIEFDNESVQNEDDMVFVPPKCMAEIKEYINLSRKYQNYLFIDSFSSRSPGKFVILWLFKIEM